MGRWRAVLAIPIALAIAIGALPTSLATAAPAGLLYGFGNNQYGQLGNSTNTMTGKANPTPTLVGLPGISGRITQVAIGDSYSLVLTSTEQLYAFGFNIVGQLGNSTNNGTINPNPTPTLVSLPAGASGTIAQIAAGGGQNLILTSTGQLYAFGGNAYGQLGIATNSGTVNPNPTPALVNLPGATGTVAQIAAGESHSLALTSTGQLYAFGNNRYGELGNATNNGNNNPNPTPTAVTLPGATGPVTQIAAGSVHSLALTSTGQLYAFGDNHHGQLGNTTNNGNDNANPTPTLVSFPSGTIARIVAGGDHNLILTSTGQLYAFGRNTFGELGSTVNNGTDGASPTPSQVTLPPSAGSIAQIAAGTIHSLVLTSTGQLYAFGNNQYGELGNAIGNATSTPFPTPTSVDFPAGTTIDAVAPGSGATHTLALVAGLEVSGLSETHRKWRVGGKAAQISSLRPKRGKKPKRKPPIGTAFTFNLNGVGQVKFAFARQAPGRKVGGKCRRATKKNRRHKPCKRSLRVGTLSFAGHTGANRVAFQGRIPGSKKLKPGSYKLTVSATNSAGTSDPQSIGFAIVK